MAHAFERRSGPRPVWGGGRGLRCNSCAPRATPDRVPVFEDWLWHAVLPLIAYAFLLVAAVMLRSYPQRVLFVVGATALVLLFIGIHNAWDTVTYIAVKGLLRPKPT